MVWFKNVLRCRSVCWSSQDWLSHKVWRQLRKELFSPSIYTRCFDVKAIVVCWTCRHALYAFKGKGSLCNLLIAGDTLGIVLLQLLVTGCRLSASRSSSLGWMNCGNQKLLPPAQRQHEAIDLASENKSNFLFIYVFLRNKYGKLCNWKQVLSKNQGPWGANWCFLILVICVNSNSLYFKQDGASLKPQIGTESFIFSRSHIITWWYIK